LPTARRCRPGLFQRSRREARTLGDGGFEVAFTAADQQALDDIGGSGVSLTGSANLYPDRRVR
jgi:hypothetical protein